MRSDWGPSACWSGDIHLSSSGTTQFRYNRSYTMGIWSFSWINAKDQSGCWSGNIYMCH